jgi:hypothetical protein
MASRALPHPSHLLIIAVISIMVLVLTRPNSAANQLVSHWRPAPIITEPDQPAQHPQPPPPAAIIGTLLPADQFDISVDDGLYPDQRQPLAEELQRALAYDISRFGSGPTARFKVSVVRDDSCGLHGIAYTDVRSLQVYTCPDLGRERAVTIMAHEFVHQLEQDRYGPAHLSADVMLSEGLATWGAGDYWLSGQPDFRSFVRAQRSGGLFFPLATAYNGRGIAAMNALYYEWASFVDFLIGTYGRAKFDQLYVSGHSAPGSADYAGVYGKGLDVLEREWQAWLDH